MLLLLLCGLGGLLFFQKLSTGKADRTIYRAYTKNSSEEGAFAAYHKKVNTGDNKRQRIIIPDIFSMLLFFTHRVKRG